MNFIVIGQIGRPCGLKGWVWLQTENKNQFDYKIIWIQQQNSAEWLLKSILQVKQVGSKITLHFSDCDDRNAATALQGARVAIPREVLAPLSVGEYYWCDIQGLNVENRDGKDLGYVKTLIETGSNDVLVLEKNNQEYLVPFIKQVILAIDFKKKLLIVDWDSDF